jgi:hypothetical protein
MNLIGNCTQENLIEDIFGSVSEFARQVEQNGNSFIYNKKIIIKYNKSNDVHYFYY